MQHPERPSRVEERRDEQQAERQPDVPGVEPLAEVAVVAARHDPGGLHALPGFDHRPVSPSTVTSASFFVPGEVADAPVAAALEERRCCPGAGLGGVRAPSGPRGPVGDRDRLPRGEMRGRLLLARRAAPGGCPSQGRPRPAWRCALRSIRGQRRRRRRSMPARAPTRGPRSAAGGGRGAGWAGWRKGEGRHRVTATSALVLRALSAGPVASATDLAGLVRLP